MKSQPVKVEVDLSTIETVCAELRELVREAHGVTGDLRKAVKDARRTVESDIAQTMEAEVKRQVAELGEVTAEAMRNSVAKVGREFDRLEAIFLGADPQSKRKGRPPLEDLIREHLNSTRSQRGDT
ncbi:hypothetical protein DP939_02335 [Spongiactinospora rosea]|uniref:Uncharacterized protein n=1 Tax=Spongiactinospora rosea TaxID=2248750 RepID=A0A366M7P7_9ACTN|nr:hypothetical protein [Spongiactinospora rosea]RBQ21569.1 hypothetical protein DP939_02335 [Spongiactinospora rosea]